VQDLFSAKILQRQALFQCLLCHVTRPLTRGDAGGEGPTRFSSPPEKCVGHRLKLLDIVQKLWAPPRKLLAPPGVPSWLRACM